MRPKVVIAILALGVVVVGLIVVMSKALQPQSTATNPAPGTATPSGGGQTSLPVTRSNVFVALPASNPAPVAVAGTNDAAAHAASVEKRIEELEALSWHNDTTSRDVILSELKNNPDRKIRAAALEAAIQFNDRSVVPPMQEIAAQTQDPDEKAAILEAIDYINLPSLTEYRAAHKKDGPRQPPAQTQPSNPGR